MKQIQKSTILLLLIASLLLTACGQSPTETTPSQDDTTPVETVPETTPLEGLPSADFGGAD